MSLWVVVGGQFGSEGKGKISAFITKHEDIDIAVRCGGPNSGHSFVDANGRNIILRQISTGFVNPRTRLLIPAGALIDPLVLKHEIDSLNLAPWRVGVDRNCFVIEERDREAEHSLHLRERLSSTLCGVGSAVSRRALRGEDARTAEKATRDYPWLQDHLTHVSDELNAAIDDGKKILVEGTQGFGLSLYHSDFYPHCTSRDTTASGFLSEVGLSPRLVTEIVVVFRAFPIRVAGDQAGPLKDEISWGQLQRESGCPHDITERTSVTNKIRRVARFDWPLATQSVLVNRPTRIAVNCIDHLDYRNHEAQRVEDIGEQSLQFLQELERRSSTRIKYVGTGPTLEASFEVSLDLATA